MSLRADLETCSDVLDRLEAWIDGELDAEEATCVEAHVDRCASCRAASREAEELVVGLRSLPEFDVPKRVVQAVKGRATPSFWSRLGETARSSFLRPAPALAAVAAVAMIVLVLSPWRSRPTSTFTDQEIARATAETKLALAYVGSAARRAELSVKESVFEDGAVSKTIRGFNRSLNFIGGAATAEAEVSATPRPHAKGS